MNLGLDPVVVHLPGITDCSNDAKLHRHTICNYSSSGARYKYHTYLLHHRSRRSDYETTSLMFCGNDCFPTTPLSRRKYMVIFLSSYMCLHHCRGTAD